MAQAPEGLGGLGREPGFQGHPGVRPVHRLHAEAGPVDGRLRLEATPGRKATGTDHCAKGKRDKGLLHGFRCYVQVKNR